MNRNETFAQGAEPGDAPIESEEVPIDPLTQGRIDRMMRLRNFNARNATPLEVAQVLADLRDHFGLGEEEGL